MITFLFYIIICFLLLQFVKEANERLYSVIAISIIFVLLQLFIENVMMTYLQTLIKTFQTLPTIGLLLSSLFLLFIGELFSQLLDQFEMKTLQVFVKYSIGITLSLLWLDELLPLLQLIEQYVMKVTS